MKRLLLFVFLLTGLTSSLFAQGFVYHPVSPSFGGSPFNYSWILGQAQSQDRNTDPVAKRNAAASAAAAASSNSSSNSTLDNFQRTIESQILQRISSQLINNKFGENDLKPGTYTLGQYQVTIQNGADGVVVRIVDAQGGETSVTVPYF